MSTSNSQILSRTGSLRFRLLVFAGGLVLLLFTAAIASTWTIRSMEDSSIHMDLLGQGRVLAATITATAETMGRVDDQDRRSELRRELRDLSDRIDARNALLRYGDASGELSAMTSPEARAFLDEHRRDWDDLFRPLVWDLIESGDRPSPAELDNIQEVSQLWIADLYDAMNAMGLKEKGYIRRQFTILGLLLLLSMVLGGFVVRTTRRLSVGLNDLSILARDAGPEDNGDATANSASGDEIDLLKNAFNTMLEHRRKIDLRRDKLVASIRDLTLRLSSATAELHAATAQHNAGSHEQLVSVSETVATVEEVTITSKQAAERAQTVSDSAKLAQDAGEAGREAVQQTVDGLATVRQHAEALAEKIVGLAEGAHQIGSIIETVDHIAEQSNLLALNAAIEAARAGEKGHGFAVVASEIKILAEQSRNATSQVQQILTTIERSTREAVEATRQNTEKLNETIDLSQRAGASIDTLADTLSQSARAATQILGSARQQSLGMSQIQEAMGAIETVVQHSLASTAQSEAALGQLAAMLDDLEELLNSGIL